MQQWPWLWPLRSPNVRSESSILDFLLVFKPSQLKQVSSLNEFWSCQLRYSVTILSRDLTICMHSRGLVLMSFSAVGDFESRRNKLTSVKHHDRTDPGSRSNEMVQYIGLAICDFLLLPDSNRMSIFHASFTFHTLLHSHLLSLGQNYPPPPSHTHTHLPWSEFCQNQIISSLGQRKYGSHPKRIWMVDYFLIYFVQRAHRHTEAWQ